MRLPNFLSCNSDLLLEATSTMANLPFFTETFHRETYPGISPTRPEQSAAGKVIVVTGAGGKIGKAICKAFARANAQCVGMLDVDSKRLRNAKTDVEQETDGGPTILQTFPVDITDQPSVRDVFAVLTAKFGCTHVLVNNAGYQTEPQRYRDSPLSEWSK